MDGDRIGLGIILGRAFATGPKATVDYGIFIAPQHLKDEEADVNFGMMVWAQCRFACFAMRAGNKIAYEESAAIASKFDPETGRWGLYNGDKPLIEVDVATGELRVNGRPSSGDVQGIEKSCARCAGAFPGVKFSPWCPGRDSNPHSVATART